MNAARIDAVERSLGKRLLAVLLAAIMVCFSILAVNASFHSLLHEDHQQANHQCAVTLFSQGQIDIGEVALFAPLPLQVIFFTLFPDEVPFSHIDCPLLPGRGPPSLS